MDNVNYYLVLERRLGDYNLVDINALDICVNFVANDIASIDTFTSKYSDQEIKDSVERSNMVQPGYLIGNLKIISDLNHRLDVLTKDSFQRILDFSNSEIEFDQNLKNKIFGLYKKAVSSVYQDEEKIQELLNNFKEILRNNNRLQMFTVLTELPYAKIRSIYFAIDEQIKQAKKNNLRVLEKISDNQ